MAENNNICRFHSGCLTDIENLKKETTSQWREMEKITQKQDAIMTRINVVLGGVAVACVMLAINLLIK